MPIASEMQANSVSTGARTSWRTADRRSCLSWSIMIPSLAFSGTSPHSILATSEPRPLQVLWTARCPECFAIEPRSERRHRNVDGQTLRHLDVRAEGRDYTPGKEFECSIPSSQLLHRLDRQCAGGSL